ncbi:MAG TPA: cupin domain-containing protein [Acidimicrobiales bacterium]|nr:cupin domain-containing protein [Acidimicrobiales bacterium]
MAAGPPPARGRLASSDTAPATGERVAEVVRLGPVLVEEIVTGTLPSPQAYRQEQDEWVLLLEGAAVLEVEGEPLDLSAEEWVLLPAGTPHRLLEARPGSRWLALHVWPGRDAPA